MLPWRYIVVEGVIGVGKTSLTKLLATRAGARLNLEVVEENPFLSKFYADRSAYAFQTQIFFLLSRFRQQQNLFQDELFRTGLVSDYLFAKDRIFANLNLGDDELALYNQLAGILEQRVMKPDLVIYLQARTEIAAAAHPLARAQLRAGHGSAPTWRRWAVPTVIISITTRIRPCWW